jgi:hypothetical protein
MRVTLNFKIQTMLLNKALNPKKDKQRTAEENQKK